MVRSGSGSDIIPSGSTAPGSKGALIEIVVYAEGKQQRAAMRREERGSFGQLIQPTSPINI
jgi:hypothetical protein